MTTHGNGNYNDITFVIELGANKNYKMIILKVVQYKFRFLTGTKQTCTVLK